MTRMRWLSLVFLVSLAGAPEDLHAQERHERFSTSSVNLDARVPEAVRFSERSSYWLEGSLIGATVGVVIALSSIEVSYDSCPLEPGVECAQNRTPYVVGSVLLGGLGAVLGGIVGSMIPRAAGHGGYRYPPLDSKGVD